MKVYFASAAFVLMASMASAQQTALEIAQAIDPQPCDGFIASAEFGVNEQGQRIVRVTCDKAGLLPRGGEAGGGLGPAIGFAAVAAAFALGGGSSGGGSSTSDTQSPRQ